MRMVSVLLGARIGDILPVRRALVHTDSAAVAQIAIALRWAAAVVPEGHIGSRQRAFKAQPGQPDHIFPYFTLQLNRNTSGPVYGDFQRIPEEGLSGHARQGSFYVHLSFGNRAVVDFGEQLI